MKTKSVVIAFDDGPHLKENLYHHHDNSAASNHEQEHSNTSLIGVVCRGIQLLHVSESTIEVDGINATEQVLALIQNNPFLLELRLILIDSPTLGGFNPPNPFTIYEKTHIPLLLIPDRKPKSHIANVYQEVFPQRHEQIAFLEKLPDLTKFSIITNKDPNISGEIYFHAIGIEPRDVHEILEYLTHFSLVPEPLRLAHLIASRQTCKKE